MNASLRKPVHFRGARSQRGISLLVVLLLLVVTSLLGIAVLRSSAMQERMSANMRDRSVAFQATEEAIRYAQSRLAAVQPDAGDATLAWEDMANVTRINNMITTQNHCATNGICATDVAASWIAVPANEYDSATLPVAPEYWIEFLGLAPGRLGAGDDTRSEEGPDNQSPMFRITARSRAPGRAEVTMQTNVISRVRDPGT